MGSKYEILAARYPWKGYYEASCQCGNLFSMIWNLIKCQCRGYEIIDVSCRNIKEQFTCTWQEDN